MKTTRCLQMLETLTSKPALKLQISAATTNVFPEAHVPRDELNFLLIL